MMTDWKFYADELMSEECWCGREKRRHYSFCWRCYRKLPADLQKALYRKIPACLPSAVRQAWLSGRGEGYEDAYEEAVKYLETVS